MMRCWAVEGEEARRKAEKGRGDPLPAPLWSKKCSVIFLKALVLWCETHAGDGAGHENGLG